MFQIAALREILRIIARHSNMHAHTAEAVYKEEGLYTPAPEWRRLLNIILLGLGVAFMLSGIIFFFAWNWQYMSKWAKMLPVEGLIVVGGVFILSGKGSSLVRNMVLMAICALTGALFSVYGQIYQTGADAYDFFLGWAVAIAIWVAASGFPPLWALELLLVNLTVFFYGEQVAGGPVGRVHLFYTICA